MATREGRKTPIGTEIDDWFDLLDEESPVPAPKSPDGPPTEASRSVTPAVDPRATPDSWDWEMDTPVIPATPPREALADEEFTDFGAPTPVASPAAPIGLPGASTAEPGRRFQGTMIFGATPLPPSPSPGTAPVTEPTADVFAPPPPPPLPPAAVQSKPVSSTPLRGRTPVPRAPVPRGVPQGLPRGPSVNPPGTPIPTVRQPTVSLHLELPTSDLDDLEFEDVSTATASPPPPAGRHPDRDTQQRTTPVVLVADLGRAQPTPVVHHSIPPEAKRSPMPTSADSAPHHSLMPPSTRREMVDRYELGDFTGALSLAETLLEIDRTDKEARRIAETSRTKLRAIYIGRLGSLDQVPVMMIPHAELRWLALDHRAGFVLSLVDGTSSIEEIIDVSTMPQLEVLRTLYNLLSQNVISLRRPRH